jgi:hypothetical protein
MTEGLRRCRGDAHRAEQVLPSRAERAYDRRMSAAALAPAPSGGADDADDAVVDVEERLAQIVGQLNALHAQLVDLVAEARRTNAWAGAGVRSLTHWLTWKAGVTNERANALVRLADAQRTHPQLSQRFADGELTVDQAAIAVKAPDYADAQVAEMAPFATVNQLRTIVRCAQPVIPAATPAAALAEDGRAGGAAAGPADSVTAYTGDDGRYHLRADLSADRGRIVDAALSAARDRLRADGGSRATFVEALVDLAERSLDGEPPARRERYRVNIFLDPTGPVPATWPDGTWLPDAIRDHVTCDGLLSPVFTSDGHPVSVGRTSRIVPPRTRRLVLHRDRGCRVPWCGAQRHLDVHHIVHWLLGGPTDDDNLVTLCSACHRAVHHGQLGISGDPRRSDGLVFTDHRGRVITGQPRAVPPSGPPPEPRLPYEPALGERLDTRSVGAALPDPPQHAPPSSDVA